MLVRARALSTLVGRMSLRKGVRGEVISSTLLVETKSGGRKWGSKRRQCHSTSAGAFPGCGEVPDWSSTP
jgi:hypothetical protein